MGRRVLVIEDEANISEAIRFILSRDGWEVRTHGDGADAAEVVARHAPDVLILDVMLPGRSGLEILRSLREVPQTRALPVLMLTAKGQSADRAAAERYGATRFMTKPFANAELVATVRAMGAA
ncbi:response regulator [Rhodobacteraceae bacterium 2376]|uniref:Response regulator n=1 Tax=Rhabdonatronobacter sediminivivens TaxID=2743469 RepID=A0A7Z0HXH9_9RHOB|nr:response regulator [Rhabdonatronobacter sediminivivens]NYS23882.1 response regulator [Rhabdonatronobacter sediminivivens]